MKFRLLSIILIFLTLSFVPTSSVSAADNTIFFGDTIPAGMIVDHDVVLFGENVVIEGIVEGNVFILGNQVIVNGTVDGSLVLIAQNAFLGGGITGSVYALALTLDIPAQASLERDLFTATVSLTSSAGSTISRHLYALGLDAGLQGTVGGNLNTMLGPIQLYNGLMQLLGFEELTLQLHFEAPPSTEGASTSTPLRHLRVKLLEPLPSFDWKAWGLSLLRNWAVLFILSLLVYWLLRKPLENSGRSLSTHPWKTLAVGIVVLVVAFNLFIVGLILCVMVFALGLGLNFLGLWPLTVVVWVLAFSALLITMVGLAFFIAFGSKIIVIYFFFTWLAGLIFHQKRIWSNLLALFLGVIIYSLLRSLPYIGWIVDLFVTAAGMGAAWLCLPKSQQPSPVLKEDPKTQPGIRLPKK